MDELSKSQLGKSVAYDNQYNPGLLFPLPRIAKREEIGVEDKPLPFKGEDIWFAFELSWLTPTGKPAVAIARIAVPCESEFLIESKSFKLYLNSFNGTMFASADNVQVTLEKDLSNAAQATVSVQILSPAEFAKCTIVSPAGECIDSANITTDIYTVDSNLLKCSTEEVVSEVLYSDLLKSNCLATGQPDWGTVVIDYNGPQLDRAALLKYIISFREHQEFHEQCVERIFMDIRRLIKPAKLTVYARYTRRGGLDINPIRSTEPVHVDFALDRFARQ